MSSKASHRVLPVLVLSQFAGTSLWFAGNAVLPDLTTNLGLDQYAVSLVTASVILGFIVGTLVFAILSLADRYSPVKLFFYCSIVGALVNTTIIWFVKDAAGLFIVRFIVGFFMAGIYPVGMKIAADWYEKGLGKAMGFLLGALVLGTAFPHLIKNRDFDLPWRSVIIYTSLFASIGGVMMLLLGNGPYRKISGTFQWKSIGEIFKYVP